MILKDSGDLKESIRYMPIAGGVRVLTDRPYAKVHNEGGAAKVFGKGASKIAKRQFIGHSVAMHKKIMARLKGDVERIIKN
jgi:phage gpG-like protein